MLDISLALWGEIAGWIGMIIFVFGNFMRSSNHIFLYQGAGNTVYCLHLFLINSIGAVFVCATATLRSFLGAKVDNERTLKNIVASSIILFFFFAAITGNNISSYFSAFAASFLSLSLLVKNNTLLVRFLNLIASFMWIAFAIVAGSLPTFALYSVSVVTCIYGALCHEPIFASLRKRCKIQLTQPASIAAE